MYLTITTEIVQLGASSSQGQLVTCEITPASAFAVKNTIITHNTKIIN